MSSFRLVWSVLSLDSVISDSNSEKLKLFEGMQLLSFVPNGRLETDHFFNALLMSGSGITSPERVIAKSLRIQLYR
jgi:hypothetical protein